MTALRLRRPACLAAGLALALIASGACAPMARPPAAPAPLAAEQIATAEYPCAGRDPWQACEDSVEQVAMHAAPVAAERTGLRLHIAVPGHPVDLDDDTTEGDRYVRHRYRSYYPSLHAHLVEVGYYEGGQYLLVTDSAGQRVNIDGWPVLSPSGLRFVTAVSDLEAQYDPSGLQIWEMNGLLPRLVVELGGGDVWGASKPRWRDENTLEYLRESADSQGNSVPTRMRLTLSPPGFTVQPVR